MTVRDVPQPPASQPAPGDVVDAEPPYGSIIEEVWPDGRFLAYQRTSEGMFGWETIGTSCESMHWEDLLGSSEETADGLVLYLVRWGPRL